MAGVGTAFSLLPLAQTRDKAADDPDMRDLALWARDYQAHSHPDFARFDDAQPAWCDVVQTGVSLEAREHVITQIMRDGFRQFDEIACTPATRHLRAVIVGFPHCDSLAGHAVLTRVRRNLGFYALRHARMLEVFHPEMEASQPCAPLPVMTIRQIVLNDAPFVARHPLLLPTYLGHFPIAGTRRLVTQVLARG